MDNKFDSIRRYIDEQASSFYLYLEKMQLDPDSWSLLKTISAQTDVYIFSGVIRNFFLGYIEIRDLDIVIRKTDNLHIPIDYIRKTSILRNSFKGYKLKLAKLNVDIWYLQNTWGIKYENSTPTDEALIRSAFFNFSAITYNFNKKKFIYTEEFCAFLKFNRLDVVYEKNPNVPLCIVNTIYYIDRFELSLGIKLCRWIVNHYSDYYDYNQVQLAHFDKILYNERKIKSFYILCKMMLNR